MERKNTEINSYKGNMFLFLAGFPVVNEEKSRITCSVQQLKKGRGRVGIHFIGVLASSKHTKICNKIARGKPKCRKILVEQPMHL